MHFSKMAQIYDYQLNDKEKAKSLYERLFTEFSGSTLAVEARQRFRKLRGMRFNKLLSSI
ncbi:MAG: hypothetical protein U0T81_18200 [Saprospiraceae bacterium]